uniref:Clp protease N-terminal domain-containing protein n=1 Tax=Rhodococcus qingshengii TaxID=334542 RepID=UPI00277D152C|nr:Clp protease N-terminal domain-containing protein [Rhodococcus qingshengii]
MGLVEENDGDIPFTPNTTKVLAQSLRETSLLGHDHVGTEHLLLALLSTPTNRPVLACWARRSRWTSLSCVSRSSGKLPSIAELSDLWSRNTSPSARRSRRTRRGVDAQHDPLGSRTRRDVLGSADGTLPAQVIEDQKLGRPRPRALPELTDRTTSPTI